MGDAKRRILLVEDQAVIGLAERAMLERAGYFVDYAAKGEDAVARAVDRAYDLVLMDVDLGSGMDGGAAARRIRDAGGPPVVFLSSHVESEVVDKTRDSGGYGFILKGSGEKVLLTSVSMALDLADAHRRLAESEERWRSLGRTAPDFIISFDAEGRILFVNNVAEGQRVEDYLGRDIAAVVHPEDRPAFRRRMASVVREGRTQRTRLRGLRPGGGVRWWDVYMGPAFAGGRVERITAVARDVTREAELADWGDLGPEARAAEVEAAMAAFDFEPIRELVARFHELTGFPVIIKDRKDRLLVAAGRNRACVDFHRAHPETEAACRESDRTLDPLVEAAASRSPGGVLPQTELPHCEYRCANGLRDMACPLMVAGVHWATIYIGQFLYEGEEIDEAEARARAARCGWDEGEYLASLAEIPRFSHDSARKALEFFMILADQIMDMAFSAYRERALARHHLATEAALEDSERRYRLLAENAGDVIWRFHFGEGRFTYVSPSIRRLRGISPEEAMAESLSASLAPESLEKVHRRIGELAEAIAAGKAPGAGPFTDLYRQPCADGSMKDVEISVTPVFGTDGALEEVIGVSRDATERVAAEAALCEALAAKDRLYGELQHRVKNSLALVVSLLTLEGGQDASEAARPSLEASLSRVRVIAALYEMLFRTKSVDRIALGDYLEELCENFASMEGFGDRVALAFEGGAGAAMIKAEKAVSAGLVLFELVSNAAAHAFPGGRAGTVAVSLRRVDPAADGLAGAAAGGAGDDPGLVAVEVLDDGVGLPPGFSYARGERLGSLLVTQLTRQLGGKLTVGPGAGGAGTRATVAFPL